MNGAFVGGNLKNLVVSLFKVVHLRVSVVGLIGGVVETLVLEQKIKPVFGELYSAILRVRQGICKERLLIPVFIDC